MDIKCLEYSTIKIPYENLNKKYRNSLKNLDRDFNLVQTFLNDSEKLIKNLNETSPDSIDTICNIIGNVAEKLAYLKKKAKENLDDELDGVEQCRVRIEHLQEGFVLSHHDLLAKNKLALQTLSTKTGVLSKKEGKEINITLNPPAIQVEDPVENQDMQVDKKEDGLLEATTFSNQAPEKALDVFPPIDPSKEMIKPLMGAISTAATEEFRAKYNMWKKKRLDRMLIEYFLKRGYYDTALALAESSDIKHLTNLDLFVMAKATEKCLIEQQTGSCLAWCHENKSKLRKIKSNLEFELRLQEFIQLFQRGLFIEAIKYSRKFFSSGLEEANYGQVKKVMGLLAYFPKDVCDSYQEYLSEERWADLVHSFRDAIFKMYQLDKQSVFCITLQAGLASLKTPQCALNPSKLANLEGLPDNSKKNSTSNSNNNNNNMELDNNNSNQFMDTEDKNTEITPKRRKNKTVTFKTSIDYSDLYWNNNIDKGNSSEPTKSTCSSGDDSNTSDFGGLADTRCPICSSNRMGLLARHLPFAHSTQSRLICRLGREPLDDTNPPLMLPNGQIYGRKALNEMANSNKGKLTCPVTRECFTLDQVEKVYIM